MRGRAPARPRHRRTRPARFLAAVVGLALAGCGASTAAGRTGPAQVVRAGATLTVDVPSVPTTLNAATVAGADPVTQGVAELIWPQTFVPGPKFQPELDTDVVQQAEVTGLSPQTVVYQLNPQAVWSDGVPITAADFVATWRAEESADLVVTAGPSAPQWTDGYARIASVTPSADGRSLTVVFSTPYADWPSLFNNLLPAHVLDRVPWGTGFSAYDPQLLVSGGPWQVAAWTPGKTLTLVPNPRWWGTKPSLGRLVLRAVPDAQGVGNVATGLAQLAYPQGFDAATLAQATGTPGVVSATSLGTTSLQLVFDTRDAPFDQPDARLGAAHLVDRAGIVTSLIQPLDPSVWVDDDHLFANTVPDYDDDGAGYLHPDATTAEKLLAAAGLGGDRRGLRTAAGKPVTITFAWASDDPWSALVAPTVSADLSAGGFDVTDDPVPEAMLDGQVLPGGHFDVALVPVPTGMYPSQLAGVFTESAPAGGSDWSGYDDPKTDTLFGQASEQLNAATARGIYQQVDQELWADMPTLPLFAEPQLVAGRASLQGLLPLTTGSPPLAGAAGWTLLGPGKTTGAAR